MRIDPPPMTSYFFFGNHGPHAVPFPDFSRKLQIFPPPIPLFCAPLKGFSLELGAGGPTLGVKKQE